MVTDWLNSKNIAGVDNGNFRSILGYAGESLVIGRALVAGFNLFFKAWRDSKYDAVMDVGGVLLRIEIKQTSEGKSISCTSGGRSGQQISRYVASRQQVLSTEDSDFLIAVHSMTGICWIIPTEVIELRMQMSIPTKYIDTYKERWDVFTNLPAGISIADLKIGFRHRSIDELVALAQSLGSSEEPALYFDFPPRTKRVLKRREDWYALHIWDLIFKHGLTDG